MLLYWFTLFSPGTICNGYVGAPWSYFMEIRSVNANIMYQTDLANNIDRRQLMKILVRNNVEFITFIFHVT